MLDEFGAEIEHADSRLDSTMKKMAKVLHLSNGNFYFSQYKPVLQIWNALLLIFGRPMHFYINRGFSSVEVVQISARIYRACFGPENQRFRKNQPKMLIFNPNLAQRRYFQLVLKR
jgi:hypothetical protein